jgi:hypothetical protein
MRPIRSFLLLLIFLACLTGLHYVIPAYQLFPSIYEFIPADLISDLFSADKAHSIPTSEPTNDSIKSIHADTITRVDTVSLLGKDLTSDPLKRFIDSLRYSSGQVRIMYYGDSQIEGDRITSYLRQSLRRGNGGTGPGLFLPVMPVMYTKTVWLKSSSNWRKYNYLSYKTGDISHPDLGPFMAVCRYLPDGSRKSVPEKAFVRIKPSDFADSASAYYDILRVFYGNTEDIVNVSVKADDREVFADTLKKGKGFNELSCQLGSAKEIVVEFEGKVSPDIFGISIE